LPLCKHGYHPSVLATSAYCSESSISFNRFCSFASSFGLSAGALQQDPFDQGARLKKLMKALNLNQSEFAHSLGMTQPNINRMLSGKSNISVEALNRITSTYNNVNLHWLLTGYGEMFFEGTKSENSEVNEPRAPYVSKGRLEELEERVDLLEEMVKRLLK
jgi:transcriptional regulator with XRE-family HTH domain